MTTQHKALRLADECEFAHGLYAEVAAELRRLNDLLGKANALCRIREERIKELESEKEALLAERDAEHALRMRLIEAIDAARSKT